MTKEFLEAKLNEVKNVVDVDVGINFLAVSYTSQGVTHFFSGRWIKDKRAQYKPCTEITSTEEDSLAED